MAASLCCFILYGWQRSANGLCIVLHWCPSWEEHIIYFKHFITKRKKTFPSREFPSTIQSSTSTDKHIFKEMRWADCQVRMTLCFESLWFYPPEWVRAPDPYLHHPHLNLSRDHNSIGSDICKGWDSGRSHPKADHISQLTGVADGASIPPYGSSSFMQEWSEGKSEGCRGPLRSVYIISS